MMEIRKIHVLEYKKKIKPFLAEYSKAIDMKIAPDWAKLNILESLGYIEPYGIFVEGEFAGFFAVLKDAEIFNPTLITYKLNTVYIMPEHRGNGFFNTVLDFLEDRYKDKQIIIASQTVKNAEEKFPERGYKKVGVLYTKWQDS